MTHWDPFYETVLFGQRSRHLPLWLLIQFRISNDIVDRDGELWIIYMSYFPSMTVLKKGLGE